MDRTFDLGNSITFSLNHTENKRSRATISIGQEFLSPLYHKIITGQQAAAITPGFSQGCAPLSYIEQTFKHTIFEHLQEFLFNYCITNCLYKALKISKTAIVGTPSLIDIKMNPPLSADFIFEVMPLHPLIPHDIHKYPFKAPERKNYKDLDKQVTAFLKEEHEREQASTDNTITTGDWVCFDIQIAECTEPLCQNFKETFWMRISNEEIDEPSYSLFLGKKIGDHFITNSPFLHYFLSDRLATNYSFIITITNVINSRFFALDLFKKHFKLKTPRETHTKLIEVFSHRNDISQRRETVEAAFKLLRTQSSVTLPKEYIEQQIELILSEIHKNPDYLVYKSQQDFYEKVHMLAIKQLEEMILIDQLSFEHNITVTQEDIEWYLNLYKRPRIKEFIYFDLPSIKKEGTEQPYSAEIIEQACLREKTLNGLIYHLARH